MHKQNIKSKIFRSLLVIGMGFTGHEAFAAVPDTLPNNLTLRIDVDQDGTIDTLHLTKRSVRHPSFRMYRFTKSPKTYTRLSSNSDLPQVRTYRGTVTGDDNVLVCAVVLPDGTLLAEGFDLQKGRGYVWRIKANRRVNVNSQMDGLPAGTRYPTRPRGGKKEASQGYDINYHIFNTEGGGDRDRALAMGEYLYNIYDMFMGRDAGIAISLGTVVTREDGEFYDPRLYTSNGSVNRASSKGNHLKIIRNEWVNNSSLNNGEWQQISSRPTSYGLFGAGGYAWQNKIGKAITRAQRIGALSVWNASLYHEGGGHNWNAIHWAYGGDTMGGNIPHHGPHSIERVIAKRNSLSGLPNPPGEYPSAVHPYTYPDLVTTDVNASVTIDVLANDYDMNGDTISISDFTSTSAKGGQVVSVGNRLRYTPPQGYVGKDTIAYTVKDNSSRSYKSQEMVFIEVVNNGLALRYSFEETSGDTTADTTGHNHPGKLSSGDFSTSTVNGPNADSGNALRISGRNTGGLIVDPSSCMPIAYTGDNRRYYPFNRDDMNTGNYFDPMNHDYAITMWFKVNDISPDKDIFLFDKGTNQNVLTAWVKSGRLRMRYRALEGHNPRTIPTTVAVVANQWHHFAIVLDRTSNQMNLFLDGVRYAQDNLPPGANIFNGRSPLRIGSQASSQTTLSVDDFRIYTQALSTSQIATIMNNPGNSSGDDDGNNSGGADALSAGQPVSGDVALSAWKYYTFTAPSGLSEIKFTTTNTTGDVDLYIKRGGNPTTGNTDQSAVTGSGNEAITLTGSEISEGAVYHVGVYGYAASPFTLQVDTVANSDGGGDVGENSLGNGQPVNANVSTGGWKYYTFTAPTGLSEIKFTTTNTSADIDLYIKRGSNPTTGSKDQYAVTSSGNETITLTDSDIVAGAVYHVGVYGYAASPFTLQVDTVANGGSGDSNGSDTLVNGQSLSGSLSTGEWKFETFTVPSGATSVKFTTTSNKDIDLFVKAGSNPASGDSDKSDTSIDGNEEVVFSGNELQAGTIYHVGVYAYEAGSYTVKVEVSF